MANKQKILIVDDDENIAELISLYMTKECFETKLVYDGESALREISSFAPDLILLDLMLPGIDGYQVCREVRQKSQTPIIMLSAKGEVFDKVLGLELGADDYLEKPFDTKELIARVKAVLRRYPRRTGFRCQASVLPQPHHQSHKLFGHLQQQNCGDAAKRARTLVLPRRIAQPCIHPRTTPRPNLGLRIHRGHAHRRCAYQAAARED